MEMIIWDVINKRSPRIVKFVTLFVAHLKKYTGLAQCVVAETGVWVVDDYKPVLILDLYFLEPIQTLVTALYSTIEMTEEFLNSCTITDLLKIGDRLIKKIYSDLNELEVLAKKKESPSITFHENVARFERKVGKFALLVKEAQAITAEAVEYSKLLQKELDKYKGVLS